MPAPVLSIRVYMNPRFRQLIYRCAALDQDFTNPVISQWFRFLAAQRISEVLDIPMEELGPEVNLWPNSGAYKRHERVDRAEAMQLVANDLQ